MVIVFSPTEVTLDLWPFWILSAGFMSARHHISFPKTTCWIGLVGQPMEHCNACGERNEGMYIAMEPSCQVDLPLPQEPWSELQSFPVYCEKNPESFVQQLEFPAIETINPPANDWATLMETWTPPFQPEKHVQMVLGLCVKPGDHCLLLEQWRFRFREQVEDHLRTHQLSLTTSRILIVDDGGWLLMIALFCPFQIE